MSDTEEERVPEQDQELEGEESSGIPGDFVPVPVPKGLELPRLSAEHQRALQRRRRLPTGRGDAVSEATSEQAQGLPQPSQNLFHGPELPAADQVQAPRRGRRRHAAGEGVLVSEATTLEPLESLLQHSYSSHSSRRYSLPIDIPLQRSQYFPRVIRPRERRAELQSDVEPSSPPPCTPEPPIFSPSESSSLVTLRGWIYSPCPPAWSREPTQPEPRSSSQPEPSSSSQRGASSLYSQRSQYSQSPIFELELHDAASQSDREEEDLHDVASQSDLENVD